MEIYLEAFIDYLRIEKGLAANSIYAYNEDLAKYAEYLKKQGKDDPKKIVRKDITEFLFTLRKKISSTSIARILSTTKSFHRFLLRDKITSSDPSCLIETPKIDQKIPNFLNLMKYQKFLKRRI